MAAITRHARRLRAFVAHPPELAGRVGFNGVAQSAPIIVVFALTPLLLDRLGLDRFGVWSLALIILSTLTILDGGVAASLARFFAVYAARSARADAGRLLLGSSLFFLVIGAALTAIAFPLAPTIVGVLSVPAGLEGEAVFVLRWLPPLVVLALLADTAAALLQGNGQFRALAATMVASSGALAIAVVLLVQPGSHLRVLVMATGLRYGVQILTSLMFFASRVSFRRPLLPARATVREFARYASRMQLSALTGFVNGQMDAIVIAAFLPIRYVGLYTIGMQAASAVRSLPLYAFGPVLTRLTTRFRNEGRREAAADFERLERRWLPAVFAYGVVAVSAIGFSVPIWLGDRYVLSGVVAALLLGCYMIHVGLTGMRTCYVRAVGRPGLETRYSLVWTVGNVLLTVPFALVGGVVGVVTATALTGIVASTYFVLLCRRREQLQVILPERRWWYLAIAAVGITVAGELAILQTGLHGFTALALAGLPPLVALVVLAAGLLQAPRVRLAT